MLIYISKIAREACMFEAIQGGQESIAAATPLHANDSETAEEEVRPRKDFASNVHVFFDIT
jgi:hypothetical protein